MTDVFSNALSVDKQVLIAFDSGARTYEPQGQKFFNKETPERFNEKFGVIAANNAITEVAPGAAYPERSVKDLGSITITQRAFKGAIPLDFLTKEFDNYGKILKEATKLGYRSRITMDEVMAEVLLGAEGTTKTWDGVSLGNASHHVGDTGATQSNVVTGALSEAIIDQMKVKLRTQKDHAGQVAPYNGATLVVPETLGMTAFKLLYSTQGPETGDRETGYLNTLRISPLMWPILDATNANDFHLIASKMFNELLYCEKVAPRMHIREDSNTGSNLYQVEFACAAGAADYLGYVFGNKA